MSEHGEIVKAPDEIEIEDGEQIIEEVIDQMNEPIEVEQVEWMGNTDVMEEQGQTDYYNSDELIEHAIVDFDEGESYQSFLPIRDGIPVLSLNLPHLLSKVSNFSEQSKLIQCFNKKCQRQVAFEGFLYTVKDYVAEGQWNNWRCVNPHCFGEIRTTPDMRELRVCHEHSSNCPQDDLQIRIRIAVYDLRLMAEFTEITLEELYTAALDRLKNDLPEGAQLFPPFETLKSTLEDHRINKIYRKRFEMQNLRDKQKKLNMTPDEVVYTENTSGLIKFRRTKPFPSSICGECHDQLLSNHLPSQDNLIAHYMYTHGRRMTIERFEFKDVNLFDQYIRELNLVSRHKLRRMGLADENMYYLCGNDDRLAKTGVGRASRLQQQNCHCTAFIRVFDWRIVSKRETSRILIDYCLEHQDHPSDGNMLTSKEDIDYYTPEVFMRDMDERRARTAKFLDEGDATQRAKRSLEMRTYVPSGRAKPVFGTRALAPPLAAQLAAGNSQPFVDCYEDQSQLQHRTRSKFRQPIRTAYPKTEEEQPSTSTSAPAEVVEEQPPPRVFIQHKPYGRMTERQNFRDIYTFNAVCKMEDAMLSILNRMQFCQSTRIALAYKEKMVTMLKNTGSDPALAESATPEDMEKSWVLDRPARGRPKKKRSKNDGDEDDEEDDDEDDDEMEDGEGQSQEQEVVEENHDMEVPKNLVELPIPSQKSKTNVERTTTKSTKESSAIPESPIKKASTPLETSGGEPPAKREKLAELRKEDSVTSTTSSTSSALLDSTTRSGRQRKIPARLLSE